MLAFDGRIPSCAWGGGEVFPCGLGHAFLTTRGRPAVQAHPKRSIVARSVVPSSTEARPRTNRRAETPSVEGMARIALRVARQIGVAARLLVLFFGSFVLVGCQHLRLPTFDPTGACLFAAKPSSTTLALPCSGAQGCGCFGCLHGLKAKLHHKHQGATGLLPQPAFATPPNPPACPPGGPQQLPADGRVISDPANCSDCADGPPAVLYGDEVLGKRPHKLPKSGKRGSILLSPQQIVAPVGGEVILLTGICGDDGYLQVGKPLEWMMTQDSVGSFIEVGNDAPGMLHKLAKIEQPDKRSGTYAIGVTSTKRSLITRGNRNYGDDVPLDKGQTWLSLSSPNEGVSRVTVLAPESDCWDQRKATATIYWIDARWQFPSAQQVLAGTPVTLSTRVTKAEGNSPARGWNVRYEILNPELALFVAPGAAPGASGSATIDVPVDASGNATAELVPVRLSTGNFASGTAAIRMQIVRPGDRDSMPDLPLGAGQTFVTWSAPQLAIKVAAPPVATFDQPVQVVANVRNSGDQPASNVTVSVALPPGTRVTQADTFARVTPANVTWEIGTIPPRTQLDLYMTLAAQNSSRLNFQARGDASLFAEDTVQIDVFRPSLAIKVTPVASQTAEVGSPVSFDIDVTNTGDRPLNNVNLRAVGDNGMTHAETGSRVIGQSKNDGPLQPGQTWSSAVSFIPLESGRRCVVVEASADGGQQAQAEGCATVINKPISVPGVSAEVAGAQRIATGEQRLYRFRVVNTGMVPLSNVRITVTYDPAMQLVSATEGSDQTRMSQYQIGWTVPSMPPAPDRRSSVLLEGQFVAVRTALQGTFIVTVDSAEGAKASDSLAIEVVQGTSPAAAAPTTPPTAPPTTPPTSIPVNPPMTPAPANPPTLPPVIPPPVIPPPVLAPSGPRPSTTAPAQPGAAPTLPPTLPPTVPAQPNPAAQPGAAAPPAGVSTLSLSLLDRDDPARVGQPIRYSLSLQNQSPQADSAIRLRFRLPPGVELRRVAQRFATGSNAFRREGDMIYLEEIRDLRGGETLDYDIELVSNQPQLIQMTVEGISRLSPGGAFANQATRVVP